MTASIRSLRIAANCSAQYSSEHERLCRDAAALAGLGKRVTVHTLRHSFAIARFAAYLTPLARQEWVVYARAPFGGPAQAFAYLGRYAHRVAISNQRILDHRHGKGTFQAQSESTARSKTVARECQSGGRRAQFTTRLPEEGDHGEPSLWPNSPQFPQPYSGDGVCEVSRGETFANSPDCLPTCGNGIADPGETSINCPGDVRLFPGDSRLARQRTPY